jgi:hypothetical protein
MCNVHVTFVIVIKLPKYASRSEEEKFPACSVLQSASIITVFLMCLHYSL